MQTCTKCIVNDSYPDIKFDANGVCSLCKNKKTYISNVNSDKELLEIFDKVKKRGLQFDALVPLSGGKDSTYILYLAVEVYKLNVLAMTYDNGFLSNLAWSNIQNAIERTKVKHIVCKPNLEIQKKIYRNLLLLSGDMCGACDIGTKANILKTAKDYSIPLILYGNSPLEEDSFVPDTIQDISRFKYILKQAKDLSKTEINEFLVYPNYNFFRHSFNKKLGIMAKEISPLFYIDVPSDKDLGNIISEKLNWHDDNREYSKHLDCLAEPFTNYIRNKIYGYERRLCQYSNMIRNNEISRELAMEMYRSDKIDSLPENCNEVLDYSNLSYEDISTIISNKALKYENKTSRINKTYARLINLKRKVLQHY